MVIEIMTKGSEEAHAIERAIRAGTDYDVSVVFRSDYSISADAQYTVRVYNKKDIPITY
jgi:hypothetical protein